MYFRICALLLILHTSWGRASLLDYIWPLRSVHDTNGKYERKNLPAVPFDAGGPDMEFIREASKFLDRKLSELDFCQQRVVLSLKESCNTLNEEEMAKLAVKFLNCQAAIEGRETFECTDSMSLKQCTEDMSTEKWNTYLIISNRAKALCYYIQQEHFRGLTEMTINKLMSSSHRHLERMDELKKSQQQVHQATIESIDEIIENNLKLLDSQKDLSDLSDTNKASIENNIREMIRQNAMLKTAQSDIFTFLSELKVQIEKDIAEAQGKNENLFETYDRILLKFNEIRDTVHKISIKIDEIGLSIMENDKKLKQQFQENMKSLEHMNSIASNISQILGYFDNEYKGKLEWLSERFGTEENLLKNMGLITTHFVCLFIGMLCLVFINVDMQSRLMFVLTIALNFIGVLYDFIALDSVRLLETVLLIQTLNFLIKMARKYDVKKYFAMRPRPTPAITTHNGRTIRDNVHITDTHVRNNLATTSSTSLSNGYGNISGHTASRRGERRSMTPVQFVRNDDQISNRSSSSHYTQVLPTINGNRCTALTARGVQCLLTAISEDTEFCRVHERSSYGRVD